MLSWTSWSVFCFCFVGLPMSSVVLPATAGTSAKAGSKREEKEIEDEVLSSKFDDSWTVGGSG